MRAWLLNPGADAPVIADITPSPPGEGEVRIRVAACGLNFADLLMIQGRYQDTPLRPYVPGLEFAGVVESLGPGVTGLAEGQRVAAFAGQGGLAPLANVAANRVLPLPDAMTVQEAAGFQIAYGTAHLALTRRAGLAPGETLVVTGAAGGVGLTAVEIGARLGARVIAVARGAEKQSIARAAGAAETLDSEDPDLRGALRALGGADVIYDTVGGGAFDPCLRALRPEGRYLAIGFASGEVPQAPLNLLLVKNLSVIGLYWGGYLRFAPGALHASLAALLAMHVKSPLKLHISHLLPFEALPEGLALLRDRKASGKIVISLPR